MKIKIRLVLLLFITSNACLYAEPIAIVPESPQIIAKSRPNSNADKNLHMGPELAMFYGVASWYSEDDPSINLYTANGEVFDDSKMACASWNFPFGTRLKITNLENGKTVFCVVNDRGPAKRLNRLIDLTKSAFRKIANTRSGLIRVSVTPVK